MTKLTTTFYKLLLWGSALLLALLLLSRLLISVDFSIYYSNINYAELYYFFNFYTVIAIGLIIFVLAFKTLHIDRNIYIYIY